MNKKSNLLILLFAAAMMVASCGSKKQGGKPNFGDDEYAVRTVSGQSTELQTTYPATVKGVQDVEIRPKVSGFITRLCVQEGQTVKKGQLLFVIDNVTYAAAVRQAKAAVNSAKAQLNTAKLTYTNNEKLFKNNVIGSYELQSAKNTLEAAYAAVAQAEANYVTAKQNLDFCYVTSPANGVIGMTKGVGGIHAAIKDYPAVKLKLADGTLYEHEGRVAAVSGVIDPTTGTVSMRADFPNPNHLLKSGASGSIVVPHHTSSAIIIPQDAVAQVQDKYFVYVVGSDNKVKYTPVTVNPNNDGKNYIIDGGLKAGDRIVMNGISGLTDGQKITPITEAQYQEKLKKTEAMGADQSDLSKLKKDFGK